MRVTISLILVLGFAGSTVSTLQIAAAEDAWKLPIEKTALKPGAGKELVIGQCLVCHSTDYISTQPPLTRPQWEASVEKMRLRYGASIPTNSLPQLLDYLTSAYGKATPSR